MDANHVYCIATLFVGCLQQYFRIFTIVVSPVLLQILNEIAQHKIKIYEFPECDDEEENKIQKKLRVSRAASWEYLSSGFLTRSDTNWAVQPQKLVRDLKLWV